MSNKGIFVAGAIWSCTSIFCVAHAEVTFHGFGQVIVGSTMDNSRPFPNEGYSADPDFQKESLFALQASAPLSQGLTATAQVLAKGVNDYSPKFEWAYVTWQADEHLQVIAGRQVLPLYRYSDYISVGQAYPWVRAPIGVYNLDSNAYDGISFASPWELGNWYLRPQLHFGKFNGNVTYVGTPYNATFTNQVGVVLEATYNEWLSLRSAYFESKVTATPTDANDPILQLISALNSAGLYQAADEVATDDNHGSFLDFAIEATPGAWFLSGEYTTAGVDHSITPRSKQYYLSAGRKFGKWFPLLTWSRTNTAPKDSSALSYIPTASPYYGVVQGALMSSALNQQNHYYEFGLRYDLRPNVALKLDYTAFQSPVSGITSANLLSGGITFSF